MLAQNTLLALPLIAGALTAGPIANPAALAAESPSPEDTRPFMPALPEEEVAPPPKPPVLSPEIRRMIETAIASGDETAARKVLAVARNVAPQAALAVIDAIEADWRSGIAARETRAGEERMARLREAGPLENWKGQVEFGAYRSTGNTKNLGVVGSLELERKGLQWTHKLSGRVELQSTEGATTAERILAGWQPNYRFDEQAYAYGIVQYERDPFVGYDDRYTLGGGIGYRAITGKDISLELEGGPALRHTAGVDGDGRSHLAGRGSVNFRWQMAPTLKLTHKTAIYLENGNNNAALTTAIDTRIIGPLQARFSYNIQYEDSVTPRTHDMNTQSRATFVYQF